MSEDLGTGSMASTLCRLSCFYGYEDDARCREDPDISDHRWCAPCQIRDVALKMRTPCPECGALVLGGCPYCEPAR